MAGNAGASASRLGARDAAPSVGLGRIVLASLVGTTVEFYDYGTADTSFPQPPANQVAGVDALSSLGGVGD